MVKARISGAGRVVCSMMLVAIVPSMSGAATWHVTYDPAQPEDRVGAVAAQAASGDTILIDPGTYYEHILVEGKSLTFIGTAGAAATILDGSRVLASRQGSIIYTPSANQDLTLVGLTLRNGSGTEVSDGTFYSVVGGAVFWPGDFVHGAVRVSDCVFQDNVTGNAGMGGGALFVGVWDTTIERCEFSGNVSIAYGSDIYSVGRQTSIIECSFHPRDGGASGMSIRNDGYSMLIERCTFESNAGPSVEPRYSVSDRGHHAEIRENVFIDRGSPLATGVEISYSGTFPAPGALREEGDFVVERNVFWCVSGPDSLGPVTLFCYEPFGVMVIAENTFVRCGAQVVDSGQGDLSVSLRRNIFAKGRVELGVLGSASASCNDFWLTRVDDLLGTVELSDNISGPPLFCNERAGDLTIATGSPCAAEHAPGGCGRIGALDPSCTVSAVKATSWGRIKDMFR
jgi:hypothetical protein